ncbi:MAG TPA: hypothetical protein VK477_04240 [Acidobacteriota bacterium]|nr:hypothetical protein [Acidobacteriota bacterium]
MNTYHVYLKKGGMVLVSARGYFEAKKEGRVYFFTDEKKKSHATFFNLKDISGIHAFEITNSLSFEDFQREYEEMLKKPGTSS